MRQKVQEFLNFLENEKHYSENTIAAYNNDLGQFVQYAETNLDEDGWANIYADTINDYVAHLGEQEYTSSTVARKVAALKSFFHFLVAEGVIRDDPTSTLDSPQVEKRLPKAISRQEVEQLLQATADSSTPKGQRDHAILELLYASGMRVTELVSLDLDDVDVEGKAIRVYGKRSSARERLIPIDDRAVEALVNYINKGRMYLARNMDEPALFLNHRGQRLTRQGLWLIIKHYVDEVGISGDVTPHTLRHSFAAHKLSQGQSLQDIQKLLGHANISTTQVYTQIGSREEESQD